MSNSVRRIIIVGARGGTNVADSLYRPALAQGLEVSFCDVGIASSKRRILHTLSWRLCDRTPPYVRRLEESLLDLVNKVHPRSVLCIGSAPIKAHLIKRIQGSGASCLHYSTDDPWNSKLRSNWQLESLPAYNVVVTPRRRTIDDFQSLGCKIVRYLPFGFDEDTFATDHIPASLGLSIDTLFVGGADRDRAEFFRRFFAVGGKATLIGAYWDRWPRLRPHWLGHRPPEHVRALTLTADVNLILVRRDNRDGHTMRSFEAGAIGACLAVEDTEEHREIFGSDGDCVRYFGSPEQAAEICNELRQRPKERIRLAVNVRHRIRSGGHTYGDRLETMLQFAQEARSAQLSEGPIS